MDGVDGIDPMGWAKQRISPCHPMAAEAYERRRYVDAHQDNPCGGRGKKSFDSLKCCCDNGMHYGGVAEVGCEFLQRRPGQSADAPG